MGAAVIMDSDVPIKLIVFKIFLVGILRAIFLHANIFLTK